MKRGQVYYADLRPVMGSEQGGIRPCVIIQNDVGNLYSPTVITAMMTTQKKPNLPTHIAVSDKDENLDMNTTIMLEQLRTIDKSRLSSFVGDLSKETMQKVDKALHISLALNKEERKEEKVNMEKILNMEGLKIFNNEELKISVRTILNDDGSISVNVEDTAIGFGWTQEKNGKTYVRWETLNGYCKEIGFSQNVGKDDYIPESLFYRLGMKASNARADNFQNWLAMEVIPSIRKTGSYQQRKMTPEEMMRLQLGMIDGLDSRVSVLEKEMTIDYGQQRVLEIEVNKTVIDSLGGKDSNAYKEIGRKVFAECNRDLKNYFNVNTRNNVPKKRFDEAVEYAKSWKPCTNTVILINNHNAQISL